MSKSNKTRTASPAPVLETELTGPEASQDNTEVSSASVYELANRQGRRDAFLTTAGRKSEAMQNKVALLSETETAIAEAVKIAGNATASAEHERQVTEASNKVAFLIFKGMINNLISKDEASEMLGRGFGWKVKDNGEQSKTPHGQGEAIRKRVVRAVGAAAFASGQEAPAFFEPLDRDEVRPFVQEVLEGKRSVFTLYHDLADMKSAASGTRPATAFNPKAVMAIRSSLAANIGESVTLIHDTPGLYVAYEQLAVILSVISSEYAAKYPEEIDAAA